MKKSGQTYKDYQSIMDEFSCIDHTITLSDFDTLKPNPYRIAHIAGDINRHNKGKKRKWKVRGEVL